MEAAAFPEPSEVRFPSGQIRQARRGYDRSETEAAFARLAAAYEQLFTSWQVVLAELQELQEAHLRLLEGADAAAERQAEQEHALAVELEEAKRELGRLERRESLVSVLLERARDAAAELKGEAPAEAEAAIKKARARADAIVLSAERQLRGVEAGRQRLRRVAEQLRLDIAETFQATLERLQLRVDEERGPAELAAAVASQPGEPAAGAAGSKDAEAGSPENGPSVVVACDLLLSLLDPDVASQLHKTADRIYPGGADRLREAIEREKLTASHPGPAVNSTHVRAPPEPGLDARSVEGCRA